MSVKRAYSHGWFLEKSGKNVWYCVNFREHVKFAQKSSILHCSHDVFSQKISGR